MGQYEDSACGQPCRNCGGTTKKIGHQYCLAMARHQCVHQTEQGRDTDGAQQRKRFQPAAECFQLSRRFAIKPSLEFKHPFTEPSWSALTTTLMLATKFPATQRTI